MAGQVFIPAVHKDKDAEPYSFEFGGKRRFYGSLDKKSKHYPLFLKAIAGAKALDTNQRALDADDKLSDLGRAEALREDATTFFKERAGLLRTLAKQKERIVGEANAVHAASIDDVDVNTLSHQRLIEAFRALPREQRARLSQPSFAQQAPEMVKALLAEPAIVTGLDSEQLDATRMNVLSDKQKTILASLGQEADELARVERAYEETAKVAQDVAQLSDKERGQIEAEFEDTKLNEPPPKTFGQGAKLKLVTEEKADGD